MRFEGYATEEGTARYRDRLVGDGAAVVEHFRHEQNSWLSSVGVGTYLGQWDEETDSRYAEAITRAVALGANVIDTAANYRFQRSERAIGAALARMIEEGAARRDELIIC